MLKITIAMMSAIELNSITISHLRIVSPNIVKGVLLGSDGSSYLL